MSSARSLHLHAALGALASLTLASQSGAQPSWHATVAAGPADVRSGAVGQLGVRVIPRGGDGWLHLRADATAGRLASRSTAAGTLALELGTREAERRPVRVFALLGGGPVWTGGTRDWGLTAGAGARFRVGNAWLSAEQRFQPGFSPFLVGFSF